MDHDEIFMTRRDSAGEREDTPRRIPDGHEADAARGGEPTASEERLWQTAAAGSGALGLGLALATTSGWLQLAGIFMSTFGIYHFIGRPPQIS